MKNKGLTIMLIILLSLLALVVIIFMVFALVNEGKFNSYFNSTSTVILDETYNDNINEINIDGVSSDILVKESSDNQIHVLVYGRENDMADSYVENQTLNISKKEKKFFCFGFCFGKSQIIVSIPRDLKGNLDIKTVSGKVEIESFENINSSIKTTSGDIAIRKLSKTKIVTVSGDIVIGESSDLELKTTSGEVEIESVLGSINIDSISGDININSFNISNDSEIKTISGDVDIDNMSDAYIDASSTSGDIKINNNNRFSEYTLKIKTTSGDIRLK